MTNSVPVKAKDALDALAWAKKNCPSYITNDGTATIDNGVVYHFYFGKEKDMIWFSLRWA